MPRAASSRREAAITTTDDRMDFDAAAAFVLRTGRCAFAAVPVFADDGETAEGARVFIVKRDGQAACRVRFIAGPFFSAALAADEVLAADAIPERVKHLRYLPSTCEDGWYSDQLQILIAKLMHASRVLAPEMPDYLAMPACAAAAEVTFPVAMIGGRPRSDGNGR